MIGLDLSISVEAAGGHVIGPISSVREAMTLLDERIIDGAILDLNLKDGEVTPVALRLFERNVPVVVQSGVGLLDELKQAAPALPVYMKPVQPKVLIEDLVERLPH